MADQASVSGARANGNGNGEGVVGSIAEFGNDVATLAELQAKLFSLDAREAAARAKLSVVLVVLGASVLLGSLPVLVAGAGLLVARALNVSNGLGLVITAGAAIVVAGVVAAVAALRLLRSFETFRRSREELVRNIAWIRTVLVHSGRAAPRRRW